MQHAMSTLLTCGAETAAPQMSCQWMGVPSPRVPQLISP